VKYRFVTFDCYGTLIDWKTGIVTSLRNSIPCAPPEADMLMDAYLRAEKEVEKDYLKYREVMKRSATRAARSLGIEMSENSFEEFSASIPDWPVFRDTKAALDKMKSLGYSLYILSNVDDNQLRGTIERNSFNVDGFITADSVRSYKPSSNHWKSFLKKTGAREWENLHVAQSIYHDIIPASKLGFDTAWVNRYGEKKGRASPTYTVANLEDLATILAR
jgi:2-haloalkanoic acid dehalogenase type II